MNGRFLFLAAALVVYALLGSPTPDAFGAVECALAVLLILAIGFAAAVRPFGIGKPLPAPLIPAQSLMLYGLSIPILMGALHGAALGAILRDAIPFLFFLLPLWAGHLTETPERRQALKMLLIVMGLAFALRDLARLLSWTSVFAADPLSYLANAPTVLFAALMLAGMAGHKILYARSVRGLAVGIGLAALAVIPVLVMAAAMQRASLGLGALVIVFWLVLAFYTAPARALRLFVPLAILGVVCWPYLEGMAGLLALKTGAVGMNSRMEELAAIWNAVAQNPGSLLFGLGWGAGFASPAVGGLQVNFAHSLLGAMLLKTGLVGAGLSVIYLGSLLRPLARHMARDVVLGMALAAPFVIDVFLYAAYKSLDFGLVLLLIAAAFREQEGKR